MLTELQTRGVQDILIACVDGLKGFPDAIQAVFPQTQIQLCILHMVRNTVRFIPRKDYKPVTADLKQIYQATTEDQALIALDRFSQQWDDKYPQISKSWRSHWNNLNTLFLYPPDTRKVIKKRKVFPTFPTDDSARKVVYLAMQEASKNWNMPIRNWKSALNGFIPSRGTEVIEFEDRLGDYV